jgi:hypothetical protein
VREQPRGLYPSSRSADQVGLSTYFGDLTNQKPLTVLCLGGFRLSILLLFGTKQLVALKSEA